MPLEHEALDKLRLEMRRGVIVLAVLAQLRTEHYGYSLRKNLHAAGISIEESTLYPLIRRLESQGLLHSEWRHEDKRKKRFYRLSDVGSQILEQLRSEWNSLNDDLGKLVNGSIA